IQPQAGLAAMQAGPKTHFLYACGRICEQFQDSCHWDDLQWGSKKIHRAVVTLIREGTPIPRYRVAPLATRAQSDLAERHHHAAAATAVCGFPSTPFPRVNVVHPAGWMLSRFLRELAR